MNRQSVDSDSLESVGYDQVSQTLEVGFRNGGVYQYFHVPKTTYEDLLRAPSKGTYLNRRIKPAYAMRRLDGGAGATGKA